MQNIEKIKLGLVVTIFVSFFLPWIAIESSAVREVTKFFTGEVSSNIETISGFKVPILANSDESRLMISIIKIFNPKTKNADKKSFLIWIVPLLPIGIYFALKRFRDVRAVRLSLSSVCILIFVAATLKIMLTDLDKVVLNINISYGLWTTLLCYLGIGVVELLDEFKDFNKEKP